MGKTTIARFLESAAKNIKLTIKGKPTRVVFKRISYDVVFSSLQAIFLKAHPDIEFQAAFDFIRAEADVNFLKMIKDACKIS